MTICRVQLFCNLKEDDGVTFLENFSTFPFAFMSMFQVLTQVSLQLIIQPIGYTR